MFIEVKKVLEGNKESEDGSTVRNPMNTEAVSGEYSICPELIRIDEIKAARPWRKNNKQEAYIDGPMTKLYMFGDKSKDKRPEILIHESYDSFAERLKAIRVDASKEEVES